MASTFPTSFEDPAYDAAEAKAAQVVGIPQAALSVIRTVGEKSNANQVSSAGAQSPYQFTPTTRQLIIDKYGVDPMTSPEAAALGAAYLWKEGFDRTGTASGAFQQYNGGTDPNNYGAQNKAYTNRTTAAFMKTNPGTPSGQSGTPATQGLDNFSGPQPFAPGTPANVPNPAQQTGSNNDQIARDYPGLSADDQAKVRASIASGDLNIDPSTLIGDKQPAEPAAGQQPTQQQPGQQQPGQQAAAPAPAGWSPDKVAAYKAQGATFNTQGQLVLSQQASAKYLNGTMDPQAAGDLKSDIASGMTVLSVGAGQSNAQGNVATGSIQNQNGTAPANPDASQPPAPDNGSVQPAQPPASGTFPAPTSVNKWTPQQVQAMTAQGATFNDHGQLVLSAEKANAYQAGALPAQQMADLKSDIAAGKVSLDNGNSALTQVGAGAGAGFGKAVLGAQNLVGEGLSKVGATTAGDWLQKDAQQGTAKLTQQQQAATGGSTAGKVGEFIGEVAPAAIAGGLGATGLGAQSALAGVQAAGESGAQGQSSGQQVTAGLLGAGATYAGGKALGYIGDQLAKVPAIAKAINATKDLFGSGASVGGNAVAAGESKDAQVAADIAAASGNRPGDLASKLEAAPQAQTPGYTPTAAEIANDAGVTAAQRTAQNAQPALHAEADVANDAALASHMTDQGTPVNPGTPANPQAANQAAEAAAQKSDVLAAQGQTEVPPITPDVAQALSKPQFEAPVKLARRIAKDDGSTVFDDHAAAQNEAYKQTLDSIVGTPDQLEAARAARGADAADNFLSTNVGIRADDPSLQSLMNRPAIKSAIAQAETDAQNGGAASIFTTAADRTKTNLGGSAPEPVQYVSGRGLTMVKQALDDQIGAATQAGENGKARNLLGLKNQLVGFLDKNIPEYAAARAKFAEASGPIDAMQVLQMRVNGAIDPATGEINPGKLVSTINSIKAEQMRPGLRPADKVPEQTLSGLADLARHVQGSDLTGLPGEGQEYIRRALASSDKHAAAHQEFQQVLNSSPAYAELHGPHAAHIATVESAQTSQTALAKAQDLIDSASSPANLRAVDKVMPDMEAADKAKAVALRQQKAHDLAMAELQTIRKNAAGGVPVENNMVNKLLGKYGKDMSPDDLSRFKSVAADVNRGTISSARLARSGGSDTGQNLSLLGTIGDKGRVLASSALANKIVFGALGFAGAGPVGAMAGYAAANDVVAPAIRKMISARVAGVTSEGAARLLSNGPMLAAKLRTFESIAARREFFRQVAQKAAVPVARAAVGKVNNYVSARNE